MIMLFIFLHIYFVYVDFVSLKTKQKRKYPEPSLTLTKDSCHFTLFQFLSTKKLFLVICTCRRNMNINKYVYINSIYNIWKQNKLVSRSIYTVFNVFSVA